MKTIAISIDDDLLAELDRLSEADQSSNRSAVVRRAVADLVERERRLEAEAADRIIFARHRERLAREAAALVEDQEP
jgi:metal-responsive CopG/Arc/MetJ family transcriptional regulator